MSKDYSIQFKLPTPNRYFWHSPDYFARIIQHQLLEHYRTPVAEKQAAVRYELVTERVPNPHARCSTPKFQDSWLLSFERADGSKGERTIIIGD